jgi:formamidopyrimidine-DNA glycosylase
MPELPEVETVAKDLKQNGLTGQMITCVRVFWPRTIHGMTVTGFCAAMTGRTVLKIDRYGKYLILGLSGDAWLLIHLRMSGRLQLKRPSDSRDRHEHVLLSLSGGRELRFRDPRKFGRFYFVNNLQPILSRLGPDAVKGGLKAARFSGLISKRKRKLKALLLDQSFIAGIGNIYADESLWEAELHPERHSSSLDQNEIRKLWRAIQKVLQRGIRNLGTSIGKSATNFYSVGGEWGRNQDDLRVFRRAGKPCPRCDHSISRLIVAQRSTHICRRCQRLSSKH